MSEKEKLRARLEQIEREENTAPTLLSSANEMVVGKCFSMPHVNKRYVVKAVNFFHYEKARLSHDGRYVEVDQREVFFFFANSNMKHVESMVKRTRSQGSFSDIGALHDVTNRGKLIPLETFESRWSLAGFKINNAVEAAMHLEFPEGDIPVYDGFQVRKEGDLDLPVIMVPANLTHWVERSVFYLGSGQYLQTPNSHKWVLDVLAAKEDERRRCARFFEECDRRYLEFEAEQMVELRRLFKL